MAVLSILKYPAPILKLKSESVSDITCELADLVNDMKETMYSASGIGLAAPQIGDSRRIVIVDLKAKEEQKGELIALINPEIVDASGEIFWEEGCLSVPDYSSDVKRFEHVAVRGIDLKGNEKTIEADGLLAIVLQHEIDHLNGILFIDRLGPLKRDIIKRRLKKQSKAG